MTEIIKKLNSTDIKKEIWSYIGYDYEKFQTNSARAIFDFLYTIADWRDWSDHQFVGLIDYPEEFDEPLNRNKNMSRRNFLIFKIFMNDMRTISDKKYPVLDIESVRDWRNNPRCKSCNDRLSLEAFQLRNHHDWKCDDCHGVDTGLVRLKDPTDRVCGICDESLIVADWITTRERHYFRCLDCFDTFGDGNDNDNDDVERENGDREEDSDDEVDMEEIYIFGEKTII